MKLTIRKTTVGEREFRRGNYKRGQMRKEMESVVETVK